MMEQLVILLEIASIWAVLGLVYLAIKGVPEPVQFEDYLNIPAGYEIDMKALEKASSEAVVGASEHVSIQHKAAFVKLANAEIIEKSGGPIWESIRETGVFLPAGSSFVGAVSIQAPPANPSKKTIQYRGARKIHTDEGVFTDRRIAEYLAVDEIVDLVFPVRAKVTRKKQRSKRQIW